MDSDSNRLLGFTQTLTTMSNGKVKSVVTAPVNYIVNANGSMTSDGLREFDYDAANRLSKVTVSKDGEAARVVYLTNAMGQRVFKSVTQAEQTLPDETTLDAGFIAWLKKSFGWLFTTPTTTGAGLGTAYVYGDGPIPAWAMLGEYDNGSAVGKGRTEYIWLPTQDGQAMPMGMYRNGKFYAVHADHLGTPRLITDEANKPVWQWPYSAFGNNTPTGVLQATPNPKQALTNQPVLLKASKPIEMNLRFPGQYYDAETGLFYNWNRYYNDKGGRYIQSDLIGLVGGMSRFAYVGSRPLTYIDPDGRQATLGARLGAMGGFALGGPPGAVAGSLLGFGGGLLLGYGLDRIFNSPEQPRGLPPDGVKPPIPEADQCKPGPASRPSERDKGGQSLWDPNGGEWRWFPGDKWHNPHWDYNPHEGKNSPWSNVPHGDLPPVKK
ncbi:hypothetical protein GHT07_19400 [Caenimonas koreensis DSM 17982]|uniref:RHS repeat-associated core domain-containing protein n=1 Tax=Caenimonas koreensis DSM 17982 TaxID=1121255 RepID=A0A844AZJ1_9BURK|nr:RHS repeat-associated core domain-containing protein [Caenimonas koreensis]MRD49444.1 hypothetical protein [Caenimonas koreensis DSM 17982]